jgi:nucleotide-binding universal stress UspA family protein
MPYTMNYHQATIDFNEARRKAQLQEIVARMRGVPNNLFSYEEVRKKLKAVESSIRALEDIPLEAIIGSVGRYTDFTRDFLPRQDSDRSRWASVMEQTTGLEGLPPIEVYKIGDAYFVKDGNHRVSVARQLGAHHIQAFITEVKSRVPLTPDLQPDQLIIKAEYANFLELTQIDQLRPDADFSLTIPGGYPIFEEHISVHRYFMGIDQERSIPYLEAVEHWYDEVYTPIVNIIRERAILKYFPHRTEADLYLWLARHRVDLERYLGWHVSTENIAEDLVSSHAQDFNKTVSRLSDRILDIVIPDPLETGPAVGHWREEHGAKPADSGLFQDLLVALDEDPNSWYSFDQAVVIAKRDGSRLLGLHILPNNKDNEQETISRLQEAFMQRCKNVGVAGELAFEVGGVARVICERAQWADIIIAQLAHPPGDKILERFESGFRTMIRRCSRPILAVPCNVTDLNHVLLAFNNSPKALEALYIAAYMAGKWEIRLTVLSIETDSDSALELQKSAHKYLKEKNILAEYITQQTGDFAEIILKTASEKQCDLILIGGYKATPFVEVVLGSIVDDVLRVTEIPVLICR